MGAAALRIGAFSALRHRNFRLWFIGQMVSLVGTWMQSVAQGWLVYQITGSRLALGTISFLGAFPTLFLMLPAGAIADRIPKRRLLLATQSLMMACAFILSLLTATRVVAVWHIGLLALILGVAQSFDAPARQSLAVEMVEDRRDLASAIALNSMMFNMARIAGPTVAGIVLATVGTAWCFLLNGLSFIAVIIALLAMRLPAFVPVNIRRPMLEEIKIGLTYVWHNIRVRSIILVVGAGTLFGMTYAVLLPAFAADVLHAGETGLGYLSAAVGVGALAGALMVASLGRTRHKGRMLLVGNLSMPLALLLFAFSRSLPMALAALALVGWASITQNATANTLIQLLVPDQLRGRVMSLYMLVFFGSGPFNALQAGFLGQSIGPGPAIAIGASLMLVIGIIVLFAAPALRKDEP
jgi:MFS family permease